MWRDGHAWECVETDMSEHLAPVPCLNLFSLRYHPKDCRIRNFPALCSHALLYPIPSLSQPLWSSLFLKHTSCALRFSFPWPEITPARILNTFRVYPSTLGNFAHTYQQPSSSMLHAFHSMKSLSAFVFYVSPANMVCHFPLYDSQYKDGKKKKITQISQCGKFSFRNEGRSGRIKAGSQASPIVIG